MHEPCAEHAVNSLIKEPTFIIVVLNYALIAETLRSLSGYTDFFGRFT